MNSRRFLDSYTTVENSPKTQKENAKLHVMAMIKREILTIREVLYTKSCKLLHKSVLVLQKNAFQITEIN